MVTAELLVTLPLVLFVGLGAMQLVLLMQSRGFLEYAVFEAARSAAVQGGRREPALEGLARGLVPGLGTGLGTGTPPAADEVAMAVAIDQARALISVGARNGWLRIERIAPSAAAFSDWAQPGRDDDGRPLAGGLVIPNDNLSFRRLTDLPRSGVIGQRSGEPVGSHSRTTLADANILKLELDYAAPLRVPLVGRWLARFLMAMDGCGLPAGESGSLNGSTPAGLRGLQVDGEQRPAGSRTLGWNCALYFGLDEHGRSTPRWPLRVSATVHMHSPAQPFD